MRIGRVKTLTAGGAARSKRYRQETPCRTTGSRWDRFAASARAGDRSGRSRCRPSSYDLATAEIHGQLLAHVHRSGTKRGAHDLIIAATASATKRTIVTTDRSPNFQDLPGVDCIVVA